MPVDFLQITTIIRDAAVATVTPFKVDIHESLGVPLAGFGTRHLWQLMDGARNLPQDAFALDVIWQNPAHGAESADVVFQLANGGAALAEKHRFTSAGVYIPAGGINLNGTNLIGARDIYFDGGGNHNIYANAALTDATERSLTFNVLNATADAWLPMITMTPNVAAPTMNFNSRPISNITLGGTVTGNNRLINNLDGIGIGNVPALADGIAFQGSQIFDDDSNFYFYTKNAGGAQIIRYQVNDYVATATWTWVNGTTQINITLGGTVTGNNQNINNLGSIGLANSAVDANTVLYFNKTIDAPAAGQYGIQAYLTLTGNTNNNLARTIYFSCSFNSATASSATHVGAMGVAGTGALAGNLTAALGTFGLVGVFADGYFSTNANTATAVTAFFARQWGASVAGGTVINACGMYIASPTVTGAVTNAFAIYIANITGAGTLNYAIYSLGGLVLLTGGIQGLMTPAVTANNQTVNAAPAANALTAANTKSFTGTAQHLVLPSITPAANGTDITLTGLALSQGAIANVADTEAITVKQLLITGAAGVVNETGIYRWTGIEITNPNQAANGANNLFMGIVIIGGAKAGGAGAQQRGMYISMAAPTDYAIVVPIGTVNFGGDVLLEDTFKVYPTWGVVGFSVVSTALTLGSAGSIITPVNNGALTDAIAGNLDGACGVDTTGAAEKWWFRAGGTWRYINKTGGLSMTKEERVDPHGHEFQIGDVIKLVVDKIFKDGSFHAIPHFMGAV